MFHFVAWDGKVIYDQPFNSKVNKTKDCTYPEMSKMAFAKLYAKSKFTSWQITSVYQLVPLTVVASCDENNSHPAKQRSNHSLAQRTTNPEESGSLGSVTRFVYTGYTSF